MTKNWSIYDHIPPDDQFAPSSSKAIVQAMKVKFDDKLWDAEEMKVDEIPEGLKESGAINVKLGDVRNSIGKDRALWKLALESELNSLIETGSIHKVRHVPKGVQVLPMKMVLTLKPVPGMKTKKKKARVCVQKLSRQKTNLFALYGEHRCDNKPNDIGNCSQVCALGSASNGCCYSISTRLYAEG